MKNFNIDYVVNGIELMETVAPEPSNRVLVDNSKFEMVARAVDKDGALYQVSYIFEDNGEDNYENYNYNQPDDCVRID